MTAPRDGTSDVFRPDRRSFLRHMGLVGGGLILGVTLGCARDGSKPETAGASGGLPAPPEYPFAPNGYVQISSDGITVFAPVPEVGQGVKTALPMIVAEELDVPWESVTVVPSPTDKALYERQRAGGSMAVAILWTPMRTAGATARHMLIQAAASLWDVEALECSTEAGAVVHRPSGKQASYESLASVAAGLPLPDPGDVRLKKPEDFRILGQRVGGVDNPQLVRGEPLFGIDVEVPGMVHATYVKCPHRGGGVKSFDADAVRAEPGVIDVFALEGDGDSRRLLPGIAILAVDTYSAFAARRRLEVEWDLTTASRDTTSEIDATAHALADESGAIQVADRGDVDAAFAAAARTVEARYEYAFLSHAQLEPQNATARWTQDGGVEVWASTQAAQRVQGELAESFGLPEGRVVVHQRRGGGGFGRRLINDPVHEAAAIAKRAGRPVKLTWTREDDMAHDFYRAGGYHSLRGGLDAEGRLIAWQNHFVTFTHDGEEPVSGGFMPAEFEPGPFVPNYRVGTTPLPLSIPTGPWRAPGSNVGAFVHQCFLHELSTAAGRDHLEFLVELYSREPIVDEASRFRRFLMDPQRAIGVLREVAARADWGRPLPDREGLGLGFCFSHAGYVAEVAHVRLDAKNRLDVLRVTAAVDVGPIVNASGAETQVQGSIVDGLSAMLAQQMTFTRGAAEQSNFDAYPLLRMPRTPEITVHFVPSVDTPTGLGEPGLPPLAPAVCNAIYAATGQRVRQLPILRAGIA